jgi:hypothetical protein
MNFCVPVKKGWHWEQISTRISFFVDFVMNVLPHAQVTAHSWYSGWTSFFMGRSP